MSTFAKRGDTPNISGVSLKSPRIFQVADLGFAKPFEEIQKRNFGTQEYKAPEIFEEEWIVSGKQDVFALGHSLVIMLTGLPMWESAQDGLYQRVATFGGNLDKYRKKDEDLLKSGGPEAKLFGIAKRTEWTEKSQSKCILVYWIVSRYYRLLEVLLPSINSDHGISVDDFIDFMIKLEEALNQN
jgi:serine/threonine protein kinase